MSQSSSEHSSASETIIPGFRAILHGGDYNPEQWLGSPEILAEDRRLRRLAGCNAFAVGIFSWSHLEPQEGVFNFDWLDKIMDDLAEDGCRAILATPSAARPPWLAKKYPEVMRVGRDRRRELYNTRHNFCWSSPIFREKVREINERLAERYKDHPALGLWHISNELGGTEGCGECFCDLCIAHWRRWLQNRYGSIEALNDAWWSGFWSHKFTEWDEINPSDGTLEACSLDWSRFVNDQMCGWVEFEAGIVRKFTPHIPVTTNFMGVNPWIDYAALAKVVDVVSDDQYPCLFVGRDDLEGGFLATAFKHDLQRNYHPGKAFFLMESCPETPQWHRPQALKHEFLHRAEMLQAIGHGAEGTCYFQWRKGRGGLEKHHGAVVDHFGTEKTRTFQIVRRLSQSYQSLGEVIGSRRRACVALLYDHDSRRMHYIGSLLAGGGNNYLAQAQEHYYPFWRHAVAVDVVDSRGPWEQGHRIVIAPHLYILQDGVAARMRKFVESGGIFVSTCLTGCLDASARCLLGGWPGDGLRELFGLWDEESDCLPEGVSLNVEMLSPRETLGTARQNISRVHSEGAEILAKFADGPLLACGGAAILRNRFGLGTAYYLAGCFDRAVLGKFYKQLMDNAAVVMPLGRELPAGVIFSSRANAEREFWFISNTTDQEHVFTLPEGIELTLLTGSSASSADGKIHLPSRSDGVWQVTRR